MGIGPSLAMKHEPAMVYEPASTPIGHAPGKRLLRSVIAPRATGVFPVCAALVTAAEPVTLRSLLGQMVGREEAQMDTFAERNTRVQTDLGRFEFRQGENTITVKLLGKNDKSQGYGFGLDYLEIVK